MTTPIVWPDAPVSIEKLIDSAATIFEANNLYFGHGTDNAWDEAMWLVFHVLDIPWSADVGILKAEIPSEKLSDLKTILQRRITERKPAAYLTGKMYFAGLEFKVNENVLVPRSPIAELINQGFAPWLAKDPKSILDLCTGSACIGIACANIFKQAMVDCTDVSSAALEVAISNINLHQCGDRVSAIESDVFDSLTQRYDLIVSNPPYVDAKDLSEMPSEYHAEPELGLAAGADGLDICRRILKQAADFLEPEGCLIVEVGNSWQPLEESFPQVPFTWVEFEYGGEGVFVFSREELVQYQSTFAS